MKIYKFIRTDNAWYIDLPEYIDQGGSKGDLQMVDGADKMPDMIADKSGLVMLCVSKEQFDKSDAVVLIEKCDPQIGGGYYVMKTYEGKDINRTMWLCGVLEFVFAEIPQTIYVKRATGSS